MVKVVDDEQDAAATWRELVAEGLTVLEAPMELMRRLQPSRALE